MSVDALLSRLEGVRPSGGEGNWRARCPAHGSKGGTLAVRELDDGRVLVHCHALCPPENVLAAIGLDLSALFPEPLGDHFPRVKKPWRVSDVVRALSFELTLAMVILGDVEHSRPIRDQDRTRAGQAADRIATFVRELENAH